MRVGLKMNVYVPADFSADQGRITRMIIYDGYLQFQSSLKVIHLCDLTVSQKQHSSSKNMGGASKQQAMLYTLLLVEW